jgi:hypothetical protein
VDPLHARIATGGAACHGRELPCGVAGDGEEADGDEWLVGLDGLGPAEVEAGEEVGVFTVWGPEELEVAEARGGFVEASFVGEGVDLGDGLYPGFFEHVGWRRGE